MIYSRTLVVAAFATLLQPFGAYLVPHAEFDGSRLAELKEALENGEVGARIRGILDTIEAEFDFDKEPPTAAPVYRSTNHGIISLFFFSTVVVAVVVVSIASNRNILPINKFNN
jgi:hypothetical protein